MAADSEAASHPGKSLHSIIDLTAHCENPESVGRVDSRLSSWAGWSLLRLAGYNSESSHRTLHQHRGVPFFTLSILRALILIVSALSLVPACAVQGQDLDILWQREGAGDHSYYGSTIIALGDQNDDSFADWAVYAQGDGAAPEGDPNEPKVEFFYGDSLSLASRTPYMTRIADRDTEIAIRGARAVGDLNGDTYIDWYIFTSYVNDPEELHIYLIYFGGPGSSGDAGGEPDVILTAPWWSTYLPIGDFNGDGFDDLILSDGWNDRAVVYFGGSAIGTASDWVKESYMGVVHAGDLNNDGYSDLLSSPTYEEGTNIFMGGTAPDTIADYHWMGLSIKDATVPDLNSDGFDELCFIRNGASDIHYGGNTLSEIPDFALIFPCEGSADLIAGGGDFNHDGFNDLAMLTDYCEDSWFGILTIHLGGVPLSSSPVVTIYGNAAPYDLMGIRTAAALGDVNGDGIDDLGIGAYDDVPVARRGKAIIVAGDPSLGVGVDDPFIPRPSAFSVSVYPNPFNASTTIEFDVPVSAHVVDLTIYNTQGQSVRRDAITVVPGRFRYSLEASSFATGLYFLRVEAAGLRQTHKLIVLR